MPVQRDYAARKTDFLARLEEELSITDIEKPLTRENYKEKFHKLLCWEEKAHIVILEERLISDVCSCTDNQKCLFLIVTGVLGTTVLICMKLTLNCTGLKRQGGDTTQCLAVF